jgi:hypothetical protein
VSQRKGGSKEIYLKSLTGVLLRLKNKEEGLMEFI